MSERKKLLLVDDDPNILKMLKLKLEKSGRFSVIATDNGAGVVSMVKNSSVDLVISDIDMPEMSGGEISAALQADPATVNIPLIFLSSLISKSEATEAGGVIGGHRVVSKTMKVGDLVKAIEDVLTT